MAQDKKRLQFILDMVDNLTAPAAKANRSLQGIGKEVMGTQKKLKDLNKVAGDISNFKSMKAQMEANTATSKDLASNTARLKIQMAMVEKPTRAMRAALRESEKAEKAHAQTTHKHAQEMLKVEGALKRAKVPLDNLDRSERNTNAAILRTNDALRKQQSELDKTTKHQEQLTKAKEQHDKAMGTAGKMAGVGAGMAAGGAALVAGNYALGSEYSKLDAAMGRVQAKDGFNNDRKDVLEEWVRKVAKDSSFDAPAVADMAEYLAGAGKAGSLEKIGADYVSLAEANNIDVASAGNYGTNVMAAFQFDDSKTGETFDKLTRLSQISKTDVAELNNGLIKLGPVATSYNQSFDDMAMSVAMFGDAGIPGAEAATALASGLNNIIAGSEPAKKSLKALGVQATDSAGKMRAAPELLAEIHNKTKGMTDDKKAGYLRDIFGVEHLPKMMMLMGKMAEGGYDQLREGYEGFAGSMDRSKKALLDSLEGDVKILGSGISELRLIYGKTFDLMYRGVIRYATKIVGLIGEWMAANPKLVKALGLVATIVGVVATAVGSLILLMAPLVIGWAKWKLVTWMWTTVAKGALAAILGLIKGIALKTAAIGWFLVKGAAMIAWYVVSNTAMIAGRVAMMAWAAACGVAKVAMAALNVVMRLNPIGLVITAVMALVAAGIWLYQNWERLPEIFSELWAKIAEFLSFDPLEMIKGAWDAVGDYFSNLFGGIWDSFMNTIGKIGEKLSGGMDWITGGFGMFDDEPTAEPVTKKLVEGGQIQPAQKTTVIEAPATYHVTIDASNMSSAELRAMFDKMAAEDRRKAEQKARARNKD